MNALVGRKTCPVINISVDIGSLSSVSQEIMNQILSSPDSGGYVCVANVHMLTVAHQNLKFKEILDKADFVVPDGMPLVWTQKLKGYKTAERVSGPDLMIQLCQLAIDRDKSIYLLGSSPETLKLLSKNLITHFPKLNIAGMHSPSTLPEDPPLDLDLVKKINTSEASLLFVGLGCPKQEFWCATHAPYLKPLLIGVGAAFDFHALTKKRSPLWMQKNGLEWLYRLISEPKRLFKRYLISNSLFLFYSFKELFNSYK